MEPNSRLLVSTVTPVYRGADYLPELVRRLDEVREAWRDRGLPYDLVEAIFVDDNAVDASRSVLADLSRQYTFVRITSLSKNFGQHPATVAGILHSSGDWVVTLDEDLQHPPEEIDRLLCEAIVEGLDVVYARPAERVHRSWYRDLSSRSYKRLLSFITGYPHLRIINSFRALRGSVARAAAAVSSHDGYLDVILGWFTDRFGSVPMQLQDERQATSGYTFPKLLSHARRALVSSQTKWLRLGAAIGVGAMVFSSLLALGILIRKIIAPESIDVRGWTSLFLAIVFFGGLSSSLIGVVLEYLSTVTLRAMGKPTFFVVDRSADEPVRSHLSQSAPRDADSREP